MTTAWWDTAALDPKLSAWWNGLSRHGQSHVAIRSNGCSSFSHIEMAMNMQPEWGWDGTVPELDVISSAKKREILKFLVFSINSS